MCIRDRPNSLLGIDVVRNQELIAQDANERKILELIPVSYTHLDVYKRQVEGVLPR